MVLLYLQPHKSKFRPDAGIGRQAWLRAMCSLERAGSSPASGTIQSKFPRWSVGSRGFY